MKKKLFVVLMAFMLIFNLTACSGQDAAQGSEGLAEDAVLKITGDGVDVVLTAQDMKDRETETITCDHVDSSGEVTQVTVTGFMLESVLQEYGLTLDDTASLNFVGMDGYIMSAPAGEYAETGVYILLNYEGDDLSYPRSCIPDKRAMYWVRDLEEVQLTAGEAGDETNIGVDQIHMFREEVAGLEGEMLNNFGYDVTSYALKDYYEKCIGELPEEPLTMLARDGFMKTETAEVFFENYVTLEAEEGEEEDLPLYFSETISDGMRVKQLDYVISGSVSTAVYFGEEVSVADLFDAVGMEEAESYSFIASDGYETMIPADALQYGAIYADEDEGYLRASFDGYDWGDAKGGGKVKYLTNIKAIGEVSQNSGEADDSSASDAALIKCFVGDERTVLSEEDFLALPQIERTLTKTNSKGETTTGVYGGVHWRDIAQAMGADSMSDAVIVASDGYEMTITADMLNDEDSLFALYQDGENIESDGDGRVWFCASENFTANNWVKYVTKIVIE